MPFDAQSGIRLREERERLGLTQQQMADEAGVRREMWSKYERGVAAPGAHAFQALARLGVDQLYVLTGQRTPKPNTATSQPLTADELELLELFRAASLARKMEVVALLTDTKPKKRPRKSSETESGGVNVSGSGNRTAGRDYHE